jgi:hypothetical protein
VWSGRSVPMYRSDPQFLSAVQNKVKDDMKRQNRPVYSIKIIRP